MKEADQKRPLAAQSSSFRAYEDNYIELMAIYESSDGRRKPAEELRELVDEALAARRARQNGDARLTAPGDAEVTRFVDVLQQVIKKTSDHTQMIARLAQHMREQYGLMLETLAAAYAARRLTWKYVIEPLLRDQGLTSEQIKRRYEEECLAWNRERDCAADQIEEAIRNLNP